jgi:hypothetical protein
MLNVGRPQWGVSLFEALCYRKSDGSIEDVDAKAKISFGGRSVRIWKFLLWSPATKPTIPKCVEFYVDILFSHTFQPALPRRRHDIPVLTTILLCLPRKIERARAFIRVIIKSLGSSAR